MIIIKMIFPSEISGSHMSLGKIYLLKPFQNPTDVTVEAAILLIKEAKTQLSLMERNRIARWV